MNPWGTGARWSNTKIIGKAKKKEGNENKWQREALVSYEYSQRMPGLEPMSTNPKSHTSRYQNVFFWPSGVPGIYIPDTAGTSGMCFIVVVLAIRKCAAWASKLITHKHSLPERRKPPKYRKPMHNKGLTPFWVYVRLELFSFPFAVLALFSFYFSTEKNHDALHTAHAHVTHATRPNFDGIVLP